MSLSMHWRPVQPGNEWPSLPYALKRAVAQRLWHHDGSLSGAEVEVGAEFVPYLNGLEDAGVDGATELIEAIRKHGKVGIWIGNGVR